MGTPYGTNPELSSQPMCHGNDVVLVVRLGGDLIEIKARRDGPDGPHGHDKGKLLQLSFILFAACMEIVERHRNDDVDRGSGFFAIESGLFW